MEHKRNIHIDNDMIRAARTRSLLRRGIPMEEEEDSLVGNYEGK